VDNQTIIDTTTQVEQVIDDYIGTGTLTNIRVGNGTAAIPSISFTNETNTGWYRTSGIISTTIGGVRACDLSAGLLYFPRGKINLSGSNVTHTAVATDAAVIYSQQAQVCNDATSSGTVAQHNAHFFGYKNLTATSATTYTNAYNTYISGNPVASTNITCTNRYALGMGGGNFINQGTGQIFWPLSTVSLPGYSFVGDPNTGMYSSTADNIDFATNGVNRLNISNDGLKPALGTVSLPSYSFIGDSNTGMYSSTADNVDIATNGVNRMNISASGVKIGANGTAILQTLTGTDSQTPNMTATTLAGPYTVTFATAFASSPIVTASLLGPTASNWSRVSVVLNTVSTTTFTYTLFNATGASTTSGAGILHWRASN